MKRVIDTVEAKYQKIHVLVNNAGITRDGLVLRMEDDAWQEVIDTNLKGTFLFSRGVGAVMMRARYGRIVNISSVAGVAGNAGQANYAASKAGLIGLTKSVAKELAGKGVTCNAVAPGFITTDMTDVLDEAWELVEHGMITEADFREFTFENAARLHTALNPEFFKGTAVEGAVAKLS